MLIFDNWVRLRWRVMEKCSSLVRSFSHAWYTVMRLVLVFLCSSTELFYMRSCISKLFAFRSLKISANVDTNYSCAVSSPLITINYHYFACVAVRTADNTYCCISKFSTSYRLKSSASMATAEKKWCQNSLSK